MLIYIPKVLWGFLCFLVLFKMFSFICYTQVPLQNNKCLAPYFSRIFVMWVFKISIYKFNSFFSIVYFNKFFVLNSNLAGHVLSCMFFPFVHLELMSYIKALFLS